MLGIHGNLMKNHTATDWDTVSIRVLPEKPLAFSASDTLMRIVLFPSMNAALSLSLGAARLPETVQTRRAGAALKNSAGFRFGWPS